MEEYEITCVKQDFFGNITHVEVNGLQLHSETIIHWVLNKRYNFYVFKNGQKLPVFAKKTMFFGWFLTSDPQSGLANNLGFLCSC